MLGLLLVNPLTRRALASDELVTRPFLTAQRLTQRIRLQVFYPVNGSVRNGEYLRDSIIGDNAGGLKAVLEYGHGLCRTGVAYGAGGAELAVVAGVELALALPRQLGGGLELCLSPLKQLVRGEHFLRHAVKPWLDNGVAYMLEAV